MKNFLIPLGFLNLLFFSLNSQNTNYIGVIDTSQVLDTTIEYGSSYTQPIEYDPYLIDAQTINIDLQIEDYLDSILIDYQVVKLNFSLIDSIVKADEYFSLFTLSGVYIDDLLLEIHSNDLRSANYNQQFISDEDTVVYSRDSLKVINNYKGFLMGIKIMLCA